MGKRGKSTKTLTKKGDGEEYQVVMNSKNAWVTGSAMEISSEVTCSKPARLKLFKHGQISWKWGIQILPLSKNWLIP